MFRQVMTKTELQIIFTVVSVFTKENFNPFSNLISPFSIGTHEIQWLFSIFLTHNWSPIYLLLKICKHGQKSCKLLLNGLISNLAKFCVVCKTAHCLYASPIDTYF